MSARRKAIVVKREQLPEAGFTREFEGVQHGNVGLSLILTEAKPGEGPALHAHPYDEVHVVHEGKAMFAGGGARGVLGAGDIIVIPAGVPHGWTDIADHVDYLSVRPDPDRVLPAGYVNPALKK